MVCIRTLLERDLHEIVDQNCYAQKEYRFQLWISIDLTDTKKIEEDRNDYFCISLNIPYSRTMKP